MFQTSVRVANNLFPFSVKIISTGNSELGKLEHAIRRASYKKKSFCFCEARVSSTFMMFFFLAKCEGCRASR